MPLIVTMYKELGLPEEYDIDLDTLYNFVDTVRQNYSDSTPFHNFHHAFCVTQMVSPQGTARWNRAPPWTHQRFFGELTSPPLSLAL